MSRPAGSPQGHALGGHSRAERRGREVYYVSDALTRLLQRPLECRHAPLRSQMLTCSSAASLGFERRRRRLARQLPWTRYGKGT